jgi:hypothetical protein
MLSGTGYLSGENYPAGTGIELFFYPHVGTGNPTSKFLRVQVRMGTTRRIRTRCHLKAVALPLLGEWDLHGPHSLPCVATIRLHQNSSRPFHWGPWPCTVLLLNAQ